MCQNEPVFEDKPPLSGAKFNPINPDENNDVYGCPYCKKVHYLMSFDIMRTSLPKLTGNSQTQPQQTEYKNFGGSGVCPSCERPVVEKDLVTLDPEVML